MNPVINEPEPVKPIEANAFNKAQPWKAFFDEPEVRPFVAEETGSSNVMRLKTEKDEHGLGG